MERAAPLDERWGVQQPPTPSPEENNYRLKFQHASTPIISVLSVLGWILVSLSNLAHSSELEFLCQWALGRCRSNDGGMGWRERRQGDLDHRPGPVVVAVHPPLTARDDNGLEFARPVAGAPYFKGKVASYLHNPAFGITDRQPAPGPAC